MLRRELQVEHYNGQLKRLLKGGGGNASGNLAVSLASTLHPLELIMSAVDANIQRRQRSSHHTSADMLPDIKRVTDCLLEARTFQFSSGRVHPSIGPVRHNPFLAIDTPELQHYVAEKQVDLHNGDLTRGSSYVHVVQLPGMHLPPGTCVCSCIPAWTPSTEVVGSGPEPAPMTDDANIHAVAPAGWRLTPLGQAPAVRMAFRHQRTGFTTMNSPSLAEVTRSLCRDPATHSLVERVAVRIAGRLQPGRVVRRYYRGTTWHYVVRMDDSGTDVCVCAADVHDTE